MSIRKFLLRFTMLSLLLTGVGRADDSARPRRMRSGMVEYELSVSGMGSTVKGTRTEWFDDYGNRMATLEKSTTTTKIMGRESTEVKEELMIVDGDTAYSIDLLKKSGFKGNIADMKKMGAMMAQGMAGPGGVQNTREFVEKNGGKWLPAETFLGRKCDVIEMLGVKTWTYKNVNLKSAGSMMGITTTQVATKFEENVRVPASKFQVPSGIEIEEQQMPDEAAAFMRGLASGGEEDGQANLFAQAMKQAQAESGDTAGESEEDLGPPSTLSLAKFKAAVAKVQLPGMQRMPVISQDGDHGLMLAGGESGFTLMAQRAALGAQFELGAAGKLSRFKHKGHDAFFAQITDPDGEEMAFILVKYPEYNMGLMVSGKPVQPRGELMKLLAQVEL